MPPLLAKPRKSASIWIGVSLMVSLLVVALTSGCGDKFSDLEVLPTESYMKKPGDFLGNTYTIRAQIDSQVKWEKALGGFWQLAQRVAAHVCRYLCRMQWVVIYI